MFTPSRWALGLPAFATALTLVSCTGDPTNPDGKATMQSCYEDATGTWCAVDFVGGVEPITIERTKGGVAKFVNVSKDLLFVDFCTAWDAGPDTVLGTADDVCTNVDHISLF